VEPHVLAVDLTGVFNVTQACIAELKAHGSGARIINVASTAGLAGYAYVSAYCAAKHGVIGLTRALALELAKKGVTVNAVCPGFADTPIISRAIDRHAQPARAEEPADLRELRRAARSVPRPRHPRRRRASDGASPAPAATSALGRRRARDHRPADRNG
jgi:NAD(P)-dependent dehydrogenase (short-subunit alcohol dehydrogenase family)